MITVVFYDPQTGRIISCSQTTEKSAELSPDPYIVVSEYRMDYDVSHKVVNGELVEVGN